MLLDKSSDKSVTIKSSWTRALAAHPAGGSSEVYDSQEFDVYMFVFLVAGLSFIALLVSICGYHKTTVFVLLLALPVVLIAFLADVALVLFLKHEVGKLQGSHFSTDQPVGFWLAFFSMSCLGTAHDLFYRSL